MTGGLNDWTGLYPLRPHSHVKIVRPNHRKFGKSGTVVRIDVPNRRVWVAFPDGSTQRMSHRSVEVVVPQALR